MEVIDKYSKPVMKAIASKDFLSTNKKLVVTSQVTPSSWRDNMVDFVVYDWDRAYPVIDVVSNTATWLPGKYLKVINILCFVINLQIRYRFILKKKPILSAFFFN